MTAPLCVAGGIALQILERQGVHISARPVRIGGETDPEKMHGAVAAAAAEGDSVGGVIECVVEGVPAGVGEPMFDGVENQLARAMFGIPAVRGVEFGEGFRAASMRGSQHNDAFRYEAGAVRTATNRHAGILGGITSGMPIVMRAAFKPTPSIALEQDSVSLSRGENTRLTVGGRHDPCIVPRAVPVVEAVMAFVLCDLLLERSGKL